MEIPQQGPMLNLEKETNENKSKVKTLLSVVGALGISIASLVTTYNEGASEGRDEQKLMDKEKLVELQNQLSSTEQALDALLKNTPTEEYNSPSYTTENRVFPDQVTEYYTTPSYTIDSKPVVAPAHEKTSTEKAIDHKENELEGPLPTK